MDGMAFSSAQGAVDSLLGRLTTALRDEVQQLRGVRGDVRFIKDEMESMNGLLLHLAWLTDDDGAGHYHHHHHHVRAWTRQVRDLANDSQGCVNRYVRHLGAGDHRRLGYLRRVHRLVRTMPARRRIAREIQELKVRAREIGERRKRYGITVPLVTGSVRDSGTGAGSKPPGTQGAGATHAAGQDDPRRLALLDNGAPTVLEKDVETMIKWLTEDAYDKGRLKVIPVLGPSRSGKSALAWRVYQDPAVASWFDCKAWSNAGDDDDDGDRDNSGACQYSWADAAAQLLANLETTQHGVGMQSWDDDDGDDAAAAELTTRELRWHLKGRRFLLVLDGLDEPSVVEDMERALQWCPYTAGSAVLVITRNKSMVLSCCPYSILHLAARTPVESFSDRALALLPNIQYGVTVVLLRKLLSTPYPDDFAMKMLLHLLFVKPNRTTQELQSLSARMADDEPVKNANEMLMFCYNDLPSHYRSCLLYLSIFPRGGAIRRTSLVRRWAVEGLVAKADGLTALDVAERCFDALVDRGFLHPCLVGAAGKVKLCRAHDPVHDFIICLVKHDSLVDRSVAPHLAPHLSIHNGIQQQPASEKPLPPCSCTALWYRSSATSRSNQFDSIVTLLDWLPRSSQLELLKVLDLEACTSLTNRHLKIVCSHLFQLKYLSLRNTDITQMPKKINKLRYLETLDIRETAVREFGKMPLVLQMLKHLLAGRTENNEKEDVIRSGESFSTVHVPHGIGCMGNIQMLSHVSVSSDGELSEICRLRKLRKLGIVLQGVQISLRNLFRVINELSSCLRSLSIRIEQSQPSVPGDQSVFKCPPKFLESISITGLRDELPDWMEGLHQLAKITLRETSLTENSLRTLGQLKGLRCLRLRHNSFIVGMLAFREGEFRNLKSLVVEGSHITNICFAPKAAPKLEKIVWSFTNVQAISGVDHLPSLKEFELNGDSISRSARQAITVYPNRRVFKYNPYKP